MHSTIQQTIKQFSLDLELIPDINETIILDESPVEGITHLMKLVLTSVSYPRSIDLIYTYDLLKADNINVTNSEGQSAFYLACIYCNIDVVTMLIDHGADVNAFDIHGTSVLFRMIWEYCRTYRDLELHECFAKKIKLLIDYGADVNFILNGCSILYCLARESRTFN